MSKRLARKIDRRQLRAGAGEVDRVGADPAAHLEDPLARSSGRTRRTPGMCGSTRYFRASTSSKYSFEPTGFGEWRMLQGRASQYCWTSATDFSLELSTIRLPESSASLVAVPGLALGHGVVLSGAPSWKSAHQRADHDVSIRFVPLAKRRA